MPWTTLFLVLCIAIIALLIAGIARRSRKIKAVAPELRVPLLWLPVSITGPFTLRAIRRLDAQAKPVTVEGVTVSTHAVNGGRDVTVHQPAAPNGGALLWIHGGGKVAGTPEGDYELCSSLALEQGLTVVNVRYSLAPEHPFPAAHNDCFAALQWLHANSERFNVDPSRIAVGGGSAGGGLAAGVVQRAIDEGVGVAFQALMYPMLDDRTTVRKVSNPEAGNFVWTRRANIFGWGAYLGPDHAQRALPAYAAPARREDLTGLPPAWIGVGDLDLFLDEDLDYAKRLEAAGAAVEVLIEPRMFHAAESYTKNVPSMLAFRQSMFEAVGRALKA